MIYLDSAATTLQKPPAVARSAAWAVGHLATPGRGGHPPPRPPSHGISRNST